MSLDSQKKGPLIKNGSQSCCIFMYDSRNADVPAFTDNRNSLVDDYSFDFPRCS